nr:MAG TPA: hypothetical protein [Caudoviricetes sp.]
MTYPVLLIELLLILLIVPVALLKLVILAFEPLILSIFPEGAIIFPSKVYDSKPPNYTPSELIFILLIEISPVIVIFPTDYKSPLILLVPLKGCPHISNWKELISFTALTIFTGLATVFFSLLIFDLINLISFLSN